MVGFPFDFRPDAESLPHGLRTKQEDTTHHRRKERPCISPSQHLAQIYLLRYKDVIKKNHTNPYPSFLDRFLCWAYFCTWISSRLMEEQGLIVRPYAYYPNPVQDELHLQYSPDITPTQIELYDLQRRLVHTQRNGLESLSMKGLASGAYTMRVVLEGGKVFSDKVIKE